jgi:hypothetical protein
LPDHFDILSEFSYLQYFSRSDQPDKIYLLVRARRLRRTPARRTASWNSWSRWGGEDGAGHGGKGRGVVKTRVADGVRICNVRYAARSKADDAWGWCGRARAAR